MRSLLKFGLAAILSIASLACAADETDRALHVLVKTADTPAKISESKVRKVNKVSKKFTVWHGELKNLNMLPMTIIFQVKDPLCVEKVKRGGKVSFVAGKVDS